MDVRWISKVLVLTLVTLAAVGCKRRSEGVSSTLPATTQSDSQRAADVTLMLDGAPVAFPPVSLQAQAAGTGVSVRLSTAAVNGDQANSLYFDLILADVEDPADLAGATWHFRSDDPERADTLNGLGLFGRAAVLEPKDVTIAFESEGGQLTVEIDGQFRMFDPPDAPAAQKVVKVAGRFAVSR